MKDLYFMRYGCIKSLAILCTVLLLSACDGLDDTTPSTGGENLAGPVIDPPVIDPPVTDPPVTDPPVIGPPGSVTLRWTPPVLRADNVTPLAMSEIDGYRIYIGTTPGIYTKLADIDILNLTVQELTVDDIPAGLYFFVMTTIDSDGRESKFSSPVVERQV